MKTILGEASRPLTDDFLHGLDNRKRIYKGKYILYLRVFDFTLKLSVCEAHDTLFLFKNCSW